MRKVITIGITLAIGVLAFTATSYAIGQGSEPQIRTNLPAAALPAFALGEGDAIRINNLLGDLGSKTGITPDSYRQVRLLASTA